MTEVQRESALKRIKKLSLRINRLETMCINFKLSADMAKDVDDIIREYKREIERLVSITEHKHEFVFNFKSGGWNSEWAYTIEEARLQAKEKYGNGLELGPDWTSFRIITHADYQNLISMFH